MVTWESPGQISESHVEILVHLQKSTEISFYKMAEQTIIIFFLRSWVPLLRKLQFVYQIEWTKILEKISMTECCVVI